MPDFPKRAISIRDYTDDWGPHRFDFDGALPPGTTISDVNVKTYLGRIDEGDDRSAETETTSELINAAKSLVFSNTEVDVYFEYPATAAWKGKVNHTLVFEVTLTPDGAKHPYYFHYVKVY